MTAVGWENFFVAEVGASAALAGLLFVGLSLNMSKIVAAAALPNRALEALGLLVAILIVASTLLVPGEGTRLEGLQLVLIGGTVCAVTTGVSYRSLRLVEPRYRPFHGVETALIGLATGFYALSGVVLIAWGEPGLYLTVPAVLGSFLIAILDSWVLLVEVNR